MECKFIFHRETQTHNAKGVILILRSLNILPHCQVHQGSLMNAAPHTDLVRSESEESLPARLPSPAKEAVLGLWGPVYSQGLNLAVNYGVLRGQIQFWTKDLRVKMKSGVLWCKMMF